MKEMWEQIQLTNVEYANKPYDQNDNTIINKIRIEAARDT